MKAIVLSLALLFTAWILPASPAAQPRAAKAPEAEHRVRAELLRVAELYQSGRYDEAGPAAEKALRDAEALLGPTHAYVAAALTNLAAVYERTGAATNVRPLYERAIRIAEKAGDPTLLVSALQEYASSLHASARTAADLDTVRSVLERARSVAEGAPGLDARRRAGLALAFADLESETGNHPRAIELLETVAGEQKRSHGTDHHAVAEVLNKLGHEYFALGNLRDAFRSLSEALPIAARDSAADPLLLATILDNLAAVHFRGGGTAEAVEHGERALAIYRASDIEKRDLALATNNLAAYVGGFGLHARAESLHVEALDLSRQAFGDAHPEVAVALNNLGAARVRRGDYAAGLNALEEALGIWERAYGPHHTNVARALDNIADTRLRSGDVPGGMQAAARAAEIDERNLWLVLASGSESEKRQYMTALGPGNRLASLHLTYAPGDSFAVRAALTDLLRRKGLVTDAMRAQVAAIRQAADSTRATRVPRWLAVRSDFSSLVFSPPARMTKPERQALAVRLYEELESLEASLASSATARSGFQRVALQDVQARLPSDAVLLEFVMYRTTASDSVDIEDRYRFAAYLLFPDGAVDVVELGDFRSVVGPVWSLNEALANPQRDDVRERAFAAYQQVMLPIRPRLRGAHHLMISRDGPLHYLPFAALLDSEGKYLLQDFVITYLSSGRDLLWLDTPLEPGTAPVVVGAPVYEERIPSRDGAEARRPALGLAWPPLPGTEAEARAVSGILPGARQLLGSAARERELKRVASPRVLHLATHGFYLLTLGQTPSREDSTKMEDPEPELLLLQSGLALAGANLREGGDGEDGILTAFELIGVDLRGTELVVLSACETARGGWILGQGMYNLERALAIAGARSQVVSRWKVDDAVTTDLMVEYYARLMAGEGRSEALRQAQLGTLANPDRAHPYYWAAFVPIGDWRPVHFGGERREGAGGPVAGTPRATGVPPDA